MQLQSYIPCRMGEVKSNQCPGCMSGSSDSFQIEELTGVIIDPAK